MLLQILILIAVVVILLSLQSVADVFPTLVGCILHQKENINVSSSAPMSRCRTVAAVSSLIPIMLIAGIYSLYPPFDGVEENRRILYTTAVFLAYLLLRLGLRIALRDRKMPAKEWKCARSIPITFFIILSTTVVTTACTCTLCSVDIGLTRRIIWWEMAVVYGICICRKTHFFASYRGFLAAFLYLCALELIPTGILVYSAIVL